jgi:hypothetical protein
MEKEESGETQEILSSKENLKTKNYIHERDPTP